MHNQVVSHETRGAADWLSLQPRRPSPSWRCLRVFQGGGPLDALCSSAHDGSPLNGMAPMYLLMSAFHSAPWLKLISSRR